MTELKSKTCCFTGHRIIPKEQRDSIVRRLEEEIIFSIQSGFRYFGIGGALGFDTLAAQTVLKLKARFPHIRLILVLPCRSQSTGWSSADKLIYEGIAAQADKIVYTSEEYDNGCMQRRNRHLIDHSSLCISYLTKGKGGTFYTVQYAKAKGVRVQNIASLDLS